MLSEPKRTQDEQTWKKASDQASPHADLLAAFHDLQAENERLRRRIQELEAIERGRSPLVLTERREHLDDLANRLTACVPHVLVLQGGIGARQRKRLADKLAAVPSDEPRVLLATGRYIGEGFDDARLDTLFRTLPVSWRGTIQQYAGRLHRTHAGKQLVQVFDYVDIYVPVLLRMLRKRIAGYEGIGYAVRWGSQEPASPRSHAKPLDTSTGTPPAFTPLQGQYVSFITTYTALNRRPLAEADIQSYFKVTPPSVHTMIVTLERRGLIRRTPGQARAIKVLVPREQLPSLAEPRI